MANHLHIGDLPTGLELGTSVAIDTEAMGLEPSRDRLCLVQLSSGDGNCHLVQMLPQNNYDAPNLKSLLSDRDILKIFHFARFDVAMIRKYLRVPCNPVYCTKIASKLTRTFTDKHGYKDLCRELLQIDISKQQQSSDWGAPNLSKEQINYAATDVLHLHAIKKILDEKLEREGRVDLAKACFSFIPHRSDLDLAGWNNQDIFSHS